MWNWSITSQSLISCWCCCQTGLAELTLSQQCLCRRLCCDDLTFKHWLGSALPPPTVRLQAIIHTANRCHMPCRASACRCHPLDRQVQLQWLCRCNSNPFSPAESICSTSSIQDACAIHIAKSLNVGVHLPELQPWTKATPAAHNMGPRCTPAMQWNQADCPTPSVATNTCLKCNQASCLSRPGSWPGLWVSLMRKGTQPDRATAIGSPPNGGRR